MADGTTRTSRDLGAAPPDQKPARPASEVVRDPVHCSARKKEEGAQRPQEPASQTVNGVVAPYQAPTKLLRKLLVHERSSWLRFFTQSASSNPVSVSRFLPRYTSSRLRAVGVTAPPHFYDGFDAVLARTRCKRDNGSFSTVLFSILFCVYFHATHFIASQRSPVIGRLPETVKCRTGSPWP